MGREAGFSQILLLWSRRTARSHPTTVQTRMNGPGLKHRRGFLSHNGLPTVSSRNSSRREKRRDLGVTSFVSRSIIYEKFCFLMSYHVLPNGLSSPCPHSSALDSSILCCEK